MKQAKSGFISEMQSVISSILGARDMVFDSSKLGPKTELLGCFAGSVVLAKVPRAPYVLAKVPRTPYVEQPNLAVTFFSYFSSTPFYCACAKLISYSLMQSCTSLFLTK